MPKKKDKTKAKQNRFAPSGETLTAPAGKVMGRKGEMSASHLAGPGKQVQLDIGVGQTVVIHWLQALGERVMSRVRAANNPQTCLWLCCCSLPSLEWHSHGTVTVPTGDGFCVWLPSNHGAESNGRVTPQTCTKPIPQ